MIHSTKLCWWYSLQRDCMSGRLHLSQYTWPECNVFPSDAAQFLKRSKPTRTGPHRRRWEAVDAHRKKCGTKCRPLLVRPPAPPVRASRTSPSERHCQPLSLQQMCCLPARSGLRNTSQHNGAARMFNAVARDVRTATANEEVEVGCCRLLNMLNVEASTNRDLVAAEASTWRVAPPGHLSSTSRLKRAPGNIERNQVALLNEREQRAAAASGACTPRCHRLYPSCEHRRFGPCR